MSKRHRVCVTQTCPGPPDNVFSSFLSLLSLPLPLWTKWWRVMRQEKDSKEGICRMELHPQMCFLAGPVQTWEPSGERFLGLCHDPSIPLAGENRDPSHSVPHSTPVFLLPNTWFSLCFEWIKIWFIDQYYNMKSILISCSMHSNWCWCLLTGR